MSDHPLLEALLAAAAGGFPPVDGRAVLVPALHGRGRVTLAEGLAGRLDLGRGRTGSRRCWHGSGARA